MATVKLDPKYKAFSDELVQTSRDRGVHLTDYAEGLLRLAAESCLEERPQLRNGSEKSTATLQRLAVEIVAKAVEDPHVRAATRQGRKVAFISWLCALADAGRIILKDILDKGF